MEKIIVVVSELNKYIEKKIYDIAKSKCLFEILGVLLMDDKLREKWQTTCVNDAYNVLDVKTALNSEVDSIIVIAEDDYLNLKEKLVEIGFEKNKITHFSSIVYYDDNANTGTVQIDVNESGWIDLYFAQKENYIRSSNDLERFFFESKHRFMGKPLHYYEVYDSAISRLRDRPIRMLEIGVFKGGSIQMWRSYFHSGSTIVGVDIDEKCRKYQDEDTHIEIGDQKDKSFLLSIVKKYGPFDFILDDGGHMMKDQIISFETLFPTLTEGGVYICEDCHTSYWMRYRGGVGRKGTYIEYMKEAIDDLSYRQAEGVSDFFKQMLEKPIKWIPRTIQYIPKLLSKAAFFNGKNKTAFVRDEIASMEFADSIVVVKKRHTGSIFECQMWTE